MSSDDDIQGLIRQLYDTALDPTRWEATLQNLGDLVGGATVYIGFIGADGIEKSFSARVDLPDPSDELFRRAMGPEENDFVRNFPRMPIAKLVDASAVTDDRSFERTLNYQYLFRPRHFYRSSAAVLIREPGQLASIGFVRNESLDRFDSGEQACLSLLLPHLRSALQVQTRLGSLEAERDAALAALDLLPMGVALVGRDGRIVALNAAAEEITLMADGLSIREGMLCAATSDETAMLARLIGGAAKTGAGAGFDAGGAMAVSRPSLLRPLSVLVAPLRGANLSASPNRPAAIIFVSDPEAKAETPEEILARLYGLTPAEARLSGLLIQGRGLEWSAEALGISINTARTHRRNLFDKTGVRRQAELVRLILGGPAGLRLPKGRE